MRILFLLFTFTFSVFSFAQENEDAQKVDKYLDAAASFYYKQQYVKALNLSKKALSISLSTNDEYHLALSYNLIGTIYNDFSQTKRALNFYTKALAYANKVENDTLRLWIYSNIGNVYYYNENDTDFEKSILYYSKSLKLAEKLNDSLQITFIRLNIANAFFEIDKVDAGIAYIKPLSSYIESRKNTESIITYYDLLGKYYSIKGNNKDAEINFFNAINLAKEEEAAFQLHDLYQNLSDHYYNINNTHEGAKYHKLKMKFKVDFQSEERLDTIEQVATQIELDEYKYHFEQIELKNELQNQKIKVSRIIIVSISIIILILLILIYTLYRNVANRKRNHAKLFVANQELTEAKNRAEENAVLKSQFISTVSHELRTPLYGVIGLTNIILEENKNIINQENLQSLRFSTRYLLALINDLLEINKAEENKIILKKSPFNLEKEMAVIIKSLLFMADGNGNQLRVAIDKEIPKVLLGDEIRLSQIMMNLISNALKFTENGFVKIEAILISMQETTCQVELSVSDTGIGIKEEDHQKIFENFVQIERKHGDYQGTGLGLPIVKRLVSLFGGTIQVESSENKGTKFSFVIHLDYLDELPVDSSVKSEKSSMEKKLQILVVEDNKINQIVTKKIIERNDYSCTIAETGHEAIDILKTTAFDIILMDINMPTLDGYETTKIIRELGIQTPIIALTAFERSEVEAKAKEFGISGVIIKPFVPEVLFEMMDDLLNANNQDE
ncbi:ATP-binding protein [Flavobacterium sp. SM2513]|uniref:tetratricopeptide repeat-containing hybrid sensor histidine kinase/response regulator n=1 Tax=Flavobacterium sp. SM2513 TaxID=3424766 RepID=UPI003D7F463C